jgi:hypothetical protein
MAIQSPNQMSPYAQAFIKTQQEDNYVDPSIQVARDERARVEFRQNELIADGVGPDTALAMAKRSNEIEKKARVAKIKEQDLMLQDEEYQTDIHIQKLDQQKNYLNAVSSLSKINPQSAYAKNEYVAWQGQFGNVLHGPNESIRADVQKLATEFSANLDANAKGVKSYLAKYGLSGVPEEAIDATTGMVNYTKVDEIGSNYFREKSRREFEQNLAQKKAEAEVVAGVDLREKMQLEANKEDIKIREEQRSEGSEARKLMQEQKQAKMNAVSLEKRAKQLGLVPIKLDPRSNAVTYGQSNQFLNGTAGSESESTTEQIPAPKTSTLPPAQNQATKPSQQPREGNRFRQNGVTYEYRNGSYIQVN